MADDDPDRSSKRKFSSKGGGSKILKDTLGNPMRNAVNPNTSSESDGSANFTGFNDTVISNDGSALRELSDVLTDILRAASKHPNSRVSKLIHTVEEDPSHKNIVLLLIELAEHAEYSIDFNISLKYYLDLFERHGITSDLVLNEAGLLLVNSSKIYSKRVDYVQSLVERQILTLSNADKEVEQEKLKQQESSSENATPAEKPKRSRKRALEVPSDPYEVELVPKKFKKLTDEKRFALQKTAAKPKSLQRNIEMEQHIHPAGWLHATIYDLDNEEDVDTKRNYKLFTYHIEHRYNTLVPDINFRLHFKVKDYMDAQEEEMTEDEACNTDRTWPPLSEEYVQKYIKLENYVLQQDLRNTKGYDMTMDDEMDNTNGIDVRVNMEETIDKQNNAAVETQLNNTTADQIGVSVENLNTSAINESKNDSGLGQSLLDETNKNDNTTMDATQLDVTIANETASNNTSLELATNPESLNDTTLSENDKTLNLTQTQQENDSALGVSLLDASNNSELNLTADISGNLNTTTGNETTNTTSDESSANLDITNANEANADGSGNLESINSNEKLIVTVVEATESTENKESTEQLIVEISDKSNTPEILDTAKEKDKESQENPVNEELKESIDIVMPNDENLLKATEARKDSALSDDRHNSISTENLAISMENLAEQNITTTEKVECLEIDIINNNVTDRSQIRINLPNTDDEGVYLDEYDMRMLSPNITMTNILPGVLRKNVTIHMDDELRQALELRDGIMEHFGRETYHVPVVTEPRKQKLIFNILKLPEKIVRRKVLFKLGPEMDLFLQARSLKRPRIDPQPREYRTTKLLQWFSLNNTDMSGIAMTPPNSPGHCSEFCGFTDDEDDTVSCSEFCGFTNDEQAEIALKNLNRLSRDSGMGVDVNQLTPEKERLEIIFEESSADADKCRANISFDDNKNETTESILNQLSPELRDILKAEINDGLIETQNNTEGANKTDTEISTESLQNIANNAEDSEKLSNENVTEQSENVLIEQSPAEQINSEKPSDSSENVQATATSLEINADSQNNVTYDISKALEMSADQLQNAEELNKTVEINSESKDCTESLKNVTESLSKDIEMSSGQLTNINESNNSGNNDSDNKDCDKPSLDQTNSVDDHHADNGDDSEDETIFNLDTSGIKTKIQQWHEHLQPILAKSRERHHFDVFKLGTEIIETVQSEKQQSKEELMPCSPFSTSTSHPVASFHNIMDNKDKSYVSRYFLSTLLLANQSNIEISVNNKSSEKPSSWKDIELKLLSTKRHTVAIEDNIGMISEKKKTTAQKENYNKGEKRKETKSSAMEVDDEEDDDDEPLIRLQEPSSPKRSKKSRTATKRTSDTLISTIVDKKPKDSHLFAHPYSILRPNESSSALITNVQILPPLITDTNTYLLSSSSAASASFSTSSASSSLSFPSQISNIMDMPSTSRQAKDLEALDVNLISVQTLKPIEKVPRYSDDYDSGIFSIDELST